MSAPRAESGAEPSGGPGDPGHVATAGLSLSPFRGLRYDPHKVGGLAAVTSPPYDVVDPGRRLDLETADPHNIVRLILPRPEPEDAGDRPDRDTRYRHAARLLHDWQREGVLVADPRPALYVYEQRTTTGGRESLQRGLIGALAVSGPEAGVVLPHEDVMPKPVADRVGLMRTTRANLEPLLLTYRGNGRAAAAIERAVSGAPLLATTTSDGTHHRLWAITEATELAEISRDLATCRALIADGHHRWEMYLRLQREHRHLPRSPWDRGLVLLVDTDRYPLRVRAIHRVLQRLPLHDALAALDPAVWRTTELDVPLPDALKVLAEARGAEPDAPNAFLLTAGDHRYTLVTGPDEKTLATAVRTDRPEEWRRLDATVLHEVLLDRTWRIPDSPEHIGYLHSAEAAVREAARTGGTAVLLHPVEERVVRRLAEQGVTMPRKSTSFGPKPATGLVLRSLTLG
ncbi:DUF1015 domain-containing protein [Kitasatospora sp. NPDC049285]|uniref:DUF1015 domain-containing protein n=1 Tax=Kitasatospora sp. NPDC049285 TaxID=3157096 RepID=UPI003446625B